MCVGCILDIQKNKWKDRILDLYHKLREVCICSVVQLAVPAANNLPFHLPSSIHLRITFTIARPFTRDPLPAIESDEIVERPRFLRELIWVRRPDVRLAFYCRVQCLRRIRREWFRCGRCQVRFPFPCGVGDSVFRDLVGSKRDDGSEGVDLDPFPDVFLISEA